jgi:hypothetical protein
MSSFSPTDSALEGFRLAKENPAAVGVWAAILFVTSIITTAVLISYAGPELNDLVALSSDPTAMEQMDEEEVLGLFSALGPVMVIPMLVIIPISFVVQVILSAAILRPVVRPSDARGAMPRLSRDELMVGGVSLVKTLAIMLSYVAVMFLSVLLGILLGPIGILIAVLVWIAYIVALVFVLVRLSLASPQSLAEGRVNIFGSWALTAGRFWPIVGAYLLAFVLWLAVILVGSLLIGAISAAGMMMTGAVDDFSSIGAFFTPVRIFVAILNAVISALTMAILFSVPPKVYMSLSGRGAADAF